MNEGLKLAADKGGRERVGKRPERPRDDNGKPARAFDLGAPEHGWMPKDKILELVKRIDASKKHGRDGSDADV